MSSLREAYSPLPGFLYGWMCFLVIQTGSIAAVAVVFAKYLGVFVPRLGTGRRPRISTAPGFVLNLPLPWLRGCSRSSKERLRHHERPTRGRRRHRFS